MLKGNIKKKKKKRKKMVPGIFDKAEGVQKKWCLQASNPEEYLSRPLPLRPTL